MQIFQVDMDTDDEDAAWSLHGSGERNLDTQPTLRECSPDGMLQVQALVLTNLWAYFLSVLCYSWYGN